MTQTFLTINTNAIWKDSVHKKIYKKSSSASQCKIPQKKGRSKIKNKLSPEYHLIDSRDCPFMNHASNMYLPKNSILIYCKNHKFIEESDKK